MPTFGSPSALLVRLYPDHAAELDAAYQSSLSRVADGPPRADGIHAGERAAAALLAERQTDGAEAPNTYRPFTTAGTYNFWRPVTAIRNGDLDTSDATTRDASWEPLITTPMHPESLGPPSPCALR